MRDVSDGPLPRGRITPPRRRLGGVGYPGAQAPSAQIQITPLVDVLLVLLVLGMLAWEASRASGRTTARANAPMELLQGLSLPLRAGATAQQDVMLDDTSWLVGLGAHGQLSWRGVPVTRDILAQQLRQAREHDPAASVWLAVDEALPYADLMVWLEWLQAQQVSQLTLLSRAQSSAQGAGKP